ncbi:uncharacterized protein LOC143290575 [Babylonia areolata]|uniref:uncharacterized protein LOC143290575 n=1 Tax=Babylonia areolata TaxID=304850 RepID=UPI003FD228E6
MGNRQGGKMAARPDLSFQQKNSKKQAWKPVDGWSTDVDPLSARLHPAVFQTITVQSAGSFGTSPTSALHPRMLGGSTFDSDGNPNFVSKILREEKHLTSCLPDDRVSSHVKDHFPGFDRSDTSDVTCSNTGLHSSSVTRTVHISPNTQNHRNSLKEEFVVSQAFSDLSSPVSGPKRRCLDDDSLTKVGAGVNSSAVTCTIAKCIDRLENLKRNIEQCNTENFTHFSNTGFAQLHSGVDNDYDNADNSKGVEVCSHRRSKSMSPKTSALIGVSQPDCKTKSKSVRKLSEPSHSVHRKDSLSLKTFIPGEWSKSAENSPIIVRKALPNPGNPVMVQRTPSQSPSVERRFPANAPAASVLSECCAELLDSEKFGIHEHPKVLSNHPGCTESREASHSVRQKATAEISLPQIYRSPVSARKMPESPVLFSSAAPHHGKGKGREQPLNTRSDRKIPALFPLETSRVHHMKTFTSSSCSSSSSESPIRGPDNVFPLIPSWSTSTSSCSAVLSTTSPTPIRYCPQPKGTPIKTCTMASQPSAAVVIASRESRESQQVVNVGAEPKGDAETSGAHTTNAQTQDSKDRQGIPTSPDKQPSTSAVTEDTIIQNSQTAVFGSVSPKLLRHRRLLKDHSSPSHDQHTFPKQSNSAAAKTSSRNGDKTMVGGGEAVCTGVHTDNDDGLELLSQSAPSSFSSFGTSSGGNCIGKTLGQRIREVINEATVGTHSNKDTCSVLLRKHERVFSKDDIFTSINTSSSFSFSNHSNDKGERFVTDKMLPFQHAHQTCLAEERHKARTPEELRIKPEFPMAGTKDAIQHTHAPKRAGYSYQLSSSRDSCSSCVSDSSHMDTYEATYFPGEVAELTQANLCHRTKLFSEGLSLKQNSVMATRLGVPGHRLVTSDTSDTLSTDRDTSSSSKRESSTSTATDDTLTSFKTRSTADSVDYDEGFILPESLVFIRSADKGAPTDLYGFESEQSTVKRKLVPARLPEPRVEHDLLLHKTRKKRRKQLHVQSQIITPRHEHSDDTLKRNRSGRNVYSDEISDDSDLFDSKDDVSDLPSSRDDISDLPSSRDDISDLPSSRDDISDIPCSKGKAFGGIKSTHDSPDSGATAGCVFYRSDLQCNESRSVTRKLATHHHTSTDLSDTDVNCAFSSPIAFTRDPCEAFPNAACSSERPGDGGVAVPLFPAEPLTSGSKRRGARLPDVIMPARSPATASRTRLTATSQARPSETDSGEDRNSCEGTRNASVPPPVLSGAENVDEGKELLPQCPECPEDRSAVVFSCTIYNSTCQSVDARD